MQANVKVWPKGTHFNNRLTQISLKIGDEVIIFSDYTTSAQEQELIDILNKNNISFNVIEQSDSESRKLAVETLQQWCQTHDKHLTKFIKMFETSVKLALEKKDKKDEL